MLSLTVDPFSLLVASNRGFFRKMLTVLVALNKGSFKITLIVPLRIKSTNLPFHPSLQRQVPFLHSPCSCSKPNHFKTEFPNQTVLKQSFQTKPFQNRVSKPNHFKTGFSNSSMIAQEEKHTIFYISFT